MAEGFGRFSVGLARSVATLPADALSEETRAAGRRVILDAFACALAGSEVDVGTLAEAASAPALAGAGAATLLASGQRTAPAHAAFVNGGHVHALNFDANGASGGHVGLVALAPVLAAAESRSIAVSGAELLTASLLAGEVAERLARAARSGGGEIHGRRDGGWLLGQVIGYLAAACGAARVLCLDPEATLSALGLALMQTAGTKQVMIEGDAPAKGLYGAFACLGGVLAATLAAGGVDARMSALEGDAGLMPVFFELGEEALAGALDGFGEEWSAGSAALKRWPASGVVQPYVDAALRLAGRAALSASELSAVRITAAPAERDWLEPAAARRQPQNASAAANSIAFGVACALAHGALRIADLRAGAGPLGGAEVAALLAATAHTFDGEPAVEVVTAAGAAHREPLAPRNEERLDGEALADKLTAANAASVAPRPAGELDRLVAAVEGLDALPDVRGLFATPPTGRVVGQFQSSN
ncbi:MAG TPA: MmgE/PrpD family protein [Acidimicrobiales bacterium]|nr:MmgE/PrpD family protein [Acidimicrobiales bacterium]